MPPVKKPSPKKRPTAAERRRREEQAAAAKAAEQPPEAPPAAPADPQMMVIAAVPVGEGGQLPEGAQPLNGVMLSLEENGTLSIIPVGIHELMVGDTLNNALKIHKAKFD